jgi:hypothetical protein
MAHGIARWSLVTVTVLFVGPAALAQTDHPRPGGPPIAQPTTTQPVPWRRAAGLRVDCGQDLQQFCYGVRPGDGRLIRCLSSHQSQLSPACVSRVAAARPALGVDCGQDLQQFCYGVQPGEGRLIRCLSSHQSQLSPSCISRLAAARPAPGVAPPSESTQSSGLPSANPPAAHAVTETALRASCGPDVKRLCDGIFRNNSGVIKCLSAHRMELSVTCDLFFKEMPVERAAQKSAPKTTTAKSPAAIPAVNGAADIGAPPAANGPATTNGAADTGAPPRANDRAATPATASSAADTGAASAGNGPAATPAAANGATDPGPPALTAQPTKSAPPAASSPPARGALAFPL